MGTRKPRRTDASLEEPHHLDSPFLDELLLIGAYTQRPDVLSRRINLVSVVVLLTCRSDKRWRYASSREHAFAGSVAAVDKAGSKMSASNRSISRASDSRA